MQGLAHGNDAMPQYAGTKQKAADVAVEVENGKPVRIAKADGNFLTFEERSGTPGSRSRRDGSHGDIRRSGTCSAQAIVKSCRSGPQAEAREMGAEQSLDLIEAGLGFDFRRHLEAQARAHIQAPATRKRLL